MRTSDRLPEECREEIRAELAQNGPEKPQMTERLVILYREGWLDALAWVLGEDDQ